MKHNRWTDTAMFVLLLGALFAAYMAGAGSREPEPCPITIFPDGTWTEDGWSMAADGIDWCLLNPTGGRDNIRINANYTWHIPE